VSSPINATQDKSEREVQADDYRNFSNINANSFSDDQESAE
jgi:hypothetical protein